MWKEEEIPTEERNEGKKETITTTTQQNKNRDIRPIFHFIYLPLNKTPYMFLVDQ